MKDCFKMSPIVYSVGENYIITVVVTKPTVMWIKVADECYYDDANGVLRSDVTVHKMTVPSYALDVAKKYTVCWREVIERKPYFSNVSKVCEAEFEFSPVGDGKINVYQIADAHGDVVHTVGAAKLFEKEYGDIDLLVLNGDVIDHSGNVENFNAIHKISSDISAGRIPVICVRGNHDLRGICAEKLADYIPTGDGGKTYYTFRLGRVWGIVLDCAEDKNDDHAEYGNCNCCHAFRVAETRFIENVIKNADREYAADGVEYRLVIAHNPFTMKCPEPFNIEEQLYDKWISLLNDNVNPDVLISGHKHYACVCRPGEENDDYGQQFVTVVGSIKDHKTGYFAGCGLIFDGRRVKVVMTDEDKTASTVDLYI